MKKIPVGILGATGMVGQQYLQLLANHPWFEVSFVASSEHSAGRSYGEAIASRAHMPVDLLNIYRSLPVHAISEIAQAKKLCRLVFSAVTNEAAKAYEELYAEHGLPVISNASYHRASSDVPMLIPEVNPEHAGIIPRQQANRGWHSGFIVTKPNCSLQSYMIPLAPLHRQFKVASLNVTTLQAVSGAGHPGISSLDIMGNVIPYIAGEEEKSEQEPLKIWGHIADNHICPATGMAIAAHCNRVPVLDGHLACVSVKFEQKPSKEDILELWQNFQGAHQLKDLPSATSQLIIYNHAKDRPQPRHDREAGRGMSITVGRLRQCPLFDYRFVALSHNTIRGAAGGGILNAEFLYQQGYLEVVCQ
jgi:aspartate-semialdehyde dehydrogenase